MPKNSNKCVISVCGESHIGHILGHWTVLIIARSPKCNLTNPFGV